MKFSSKNSTTAYMLVLLIWMSFSNVVLAKPESSLECFHIKKIYLKGKDADQFKWAIAAGIKKSDLGHCLDYQEINGVIHRIQHAIVERGFVTTQVLSGPQTRLKEGILELRVFPGRIRQIHYSPSLSFKQAFWSALPLKEQKILNGRDMEQTLENFKLRRIQNANIQVLPAEGPGIEPGQSDLFIQWEKRFPFRFNMSIDDSSSKTIGKYRGSATVFYDGWKMSNQQLYINVNRHLSRQNRLAPGAHGFSVHYFVPVGYWIFSLVNSHHHYRQSVPGSQQIYIYRGKINNVDIKVSRILYRDIVRKTTLSFSSWIRNSKNFIDDTEIEIQRRRMGGWDFGASHRELMNDMSLDANINYRIGSGIFSQDKSSSKIIMADLQWNIPFQVAKQRLRYNNSWRARWNQTSVIPIDRFAIGGRYTVRGFDGENQLLAEHGWLVRNDVGLALGKTNQEFYTGIDYGKVGGNTNQDLIGHHLSGGVIGFRAENKKFSYDLFLGRPLSKPKGFKTPSVSLGFNLNASF